MDGLFIEPGALSGFRGEHFLPEGIIDKAVDQLTIADPGYTDSAAGKAVHEIGGPVDGIYNKAFRIRQFEIFLFFRDKESSGEEAGQLPDQKILDFPVSCSHKIIGALHGNLRFFLFQHETAGPADTVQDLQVGFGMFWHGVLLSGNDLTQPDPPGITRGNRLFLLI